MERDLGQEFLDQLMTTDAGRQHMLSTSVEAEEGDEVDRFGQLARFVEDPKLRRVVERHRDDEVRHAGLFRGCLKRLGLTQSPIPDELKIIRQVGEATGHADRAVETAEDVVATYALLLAIERRGVEQFPRIAQAFRPTDPETADVYLRVARDEQGHVRYCENLGRHFATSDEAWEQAVTEAAALEQDAFLHVGLSNLAYSTNQGWLSL